VVLHGSGGPAGMGIGPGHRTANQRVVSAAWSGLPLARLLRAGPTNRGRQNRDAAESGDRKFFLFPCRIRPSSFDE
jgi:hypothetical protein